MNTLQDLRATLDQHAHDVHDDASVARAAAVRGRARRTRQRRAGAVVAAAVIVVAGVVTAPMLADPTPPRGARWLAGHEAPATIESLGYTYRFVEGVESGERPATLRLPASDVPRLVTWASEADDVRVEGNVEGYSAWSGATGFDDFVAVPAVEPVRFTLRAGGAASAIAVYELDPEAVPAGITEDGLTFREVVGSERLLDATVGELGDTDVTLEVTVPESERIRVAEFCEGLPQDEKAWVNVSVQGRGAVSSGGCEDDPFDPADGSASWLEDRHLPEPGASVTVRMWISRGVLGGGAAVRFDGVRLALGAYDVGEPVAEVAGWEMPAFTEHDGHRWRFVETLTSTSSEDRLRLRNEGDQELLVVGSFHRIGRGALRVRAADGGVERTSGGLGGSGVRAILAPGQDTAMWLQGAVPDAAEFGFATYEPID